MAKEFKLTKPLDLQVELRKAAKEARQSDQLAEFSVIRAFEVYRVLKFRKEDTLTPEGQKALERLDRATEALGNARGELGDAVYQIEEVLKTAR